MPLIDRKMVSNEEIKAEYLRGVVDCRQHLFQGAKSKALMASAVTLSAVFEGDDLVISLTPATGHCFPASTGRELRVLTRFLDGAGAEAGKSQKVYDYAKKEVLLPAETAKVRMAAPSGARRAEISLQHVLSVIPGRDAEEVHEIVTAAITRE
jgi:hypothetical protein